MPGAMLFNAIVMNKCFLLKPVRGFGADSSCRFWEKRKKCTL